MTKLRFPIGVLESDDMRRIRIVADSELSRQNPGWFCAMFHCGEYLAGRDKWLMMYSVQMAKESEPELRQLLIGRVHMVDGSQVWGAVNG